MRDRVAEEPDVKKHRDELKQTCLLALKRNKKMKRLSSFSDAEMAWVANASGLLVDFDLFRGACLSKIKDSIAGPGYPNCVEYVEGLMATGRMSEYEGW